MGIPREEVEAAVTRMRMNADDERMNAVSVAMPPMRESGIDFQTLCNSSLGKQETSKRKKPSKWHPYRNKTERDYAMWLEGQRQAGAIADWKYEAVKFKIGESRCWWTPDFMVDPKAFPGFLRLEFHETKGFMRDDARVKLESARLQYPMFRFVLVRRDGQGWRWEE